MPERSAEPQVTLRGCTFPTRYHYDVVNHVWYQPAEGGLIRLGTTRVGAALADDNIFAFAPKRVGTQVEKGRSCAVVESGKWVGPARVAFDCVVETVHEALIDNPHWMVEDPYGKGWMMLVRPRPTAPLAGLVTGEAVAVAYAAWMDASDFPGCGARRR